MPNFIVTHRQQTVLLPVNFDEQLRPGTFEHALHYLIECKLDLSVFYSRYHNDDTGRPAYNPGVLLKVVLFAYAKGITSSREIEACCRHHVIFKALSGDCVPHFTTIAAFISQQPEDIEKIFEQVLLVCHDQGLLGNKLFAIDGCKMPSNAAKTWSGTFKELAQKRDKIQRLIRYHIKRHQVNDREALGDDEQAVRARKTIETLDRAQRKIERFLAESRPRLGKNQQGKEVKSNITDNQSAKMTTSKGTIQGYTGVATVDKAHQIVVDAQAFGQGQEKALLKPALQSLQGRYQRLGISPDIYAQGAVITADTGYCNEPNMKYLHDEGIDAYIPDNQFRRRDPKFTEQKKKYGKQGKPGAKAVETFRPEAFEFDAATKHCRCPAGKTLWLKNERKDAYGNDKLYFEGRLTDCRACTLKSRCMRRPESANTRTGSGRQVSFIISERSTNRPYTAWMKGRIDSEHGRAIYGQRMSVVEPVFANIGSNKGLKRFSLRGEAKVTGQWQLYCLVHNIEKIANYGKLG